MKDNPGKGKKEFKLPIYKKWFDEDYKRKVIEEFCIEINSNTEDLDDAILEALDNTFWDLINEEE